MATAAPLHVAQVLLVLGFLGLLGVLISLVVLRHRAHLACAEGFSETTPAAIRAALARRLAAPAPPRVGLVLMARAPPDMAAWLNYHLGVGVERFYVRLESDGTEADAVTVRLLRSYPQVLLQVGDPSETPPSDDLHLPGQQQMLRQRAWLATAIERAREDGIEWLVHIDSDELVEVVDADSIGDALRKDARSGTQTMVIPNYEVFYGPDKLEAANREACFRGEEARECAAGHCAAYANGKSAGRVTPGLREWGAHRFTFDAGAVQGAAPNDEVDPTRHLRIVHFESCSFSRFLDKYRVLADSERSEFPFPYYNNTIAVARSDLCKDPGDARCTDALASVFRQFRMVEAP